MIILYGGFVDLSAKKGDAVHALELTRNLRELGNRVFVVAHSNESRTDTDFFDTGGYEERKSLLSRCFLFVLSFLRAGRWVLSLAPYCDVLYIRDYLFCAIGIIAKVLYSRKIVWEVNGLAAHERAEKPHPFNFFFLPLINLLERLAVCAADRIAPVSEGVMDLLSKRGCTRSKVVLLENGVNVRMFSSSIDPSVLEGEKRKLGIPPSVPLICYVGAIRPWQGLSVLLLAAREMKRKGIDVRFLVVGGGDGLEALKEQARAEGVADITVFTGPIEYERVPLMLALSDVCVAPFRAGRAASPMKIYEYMASGRPTVASRIPGLGFVEERGLGRLVDPDDASVLADALSDLLANRRDAEEMAARAREYVVKNRSWLSVARAAEALCRELVAGNKTPQ